MTFAFSRTSRAVLRSLVPVICPPQYAGIADDIVDHMALTLGAQPSFIQRALDAGLLTYDLGALPFHRRRAHKLTGDAAERYYQSWEHGPTPLHFQLARLLNQLMSLSCYEQPAAMRDAGYDVAPWIAEVRHKRLTVFREDVRAQEQQILAPDPLRPGVRVQKKERV